MNFAAARPLGLPRVLAPPPEEAQKAKTPTPEPFDSETRKVSPHPAGHCQVGALHVAGPGVSPAPLSTLWTQAGPTPLWSGGC